MMELVDMLVLGTSAEMRVGSSPTEGNTHIKICISISLEKNFIFFEKVALFTKNLYTIL